MLESLNKELVYSVALAETKNIGPAIGRYIYDTLDDISIAFGDFDSIKKALPRLNKNIVTKLSGKESLSRAEQIVRWCLSNNVYIVPINSPQYPSLLRQCPDAPLILYVKGSVDVLNSDDIISIVGTRQISNYGNEMTRLILRGINDYMPNMCIVSGLAYGVDIKAHREALELGMPTIAVLANGLDTIYPFQHTKDAKAIIDYSGAIVSEYPPFSKLDRFNFVSRNRIIAGLSKATLVVEAGLKSGSIITADYAAEYNREVFAIPGRVGDKYSEGCNSIIRKMKAALVTDASQILQMIGVQLESKTIIQTIPFENEDLPNNKIINIISENQPVQLNDIIRLSAMGVQEVSNQLFELELDGYIETIPGGLYIISKNR